MARHLKAWWYNVDVVFAGDSAKLPADARAAFDAWREGGGTTQASLPADGHWDLVVDGLFGIGLQRDLTGAAAALVTGDQRARVPRARARRT